MKKRKKRNYFQNFLIRWLSTSRENSLMEFKNFLYFLYNSNHMIINGTIQILFVQYHNNSADTSTMQVLFAQFHNNSADTFAMQVLFAQYPALFITNIMVVRL